MKKLKLILKFLYNEILLTAKSVCAIVKYGNGSFVCSHALFMGPGTDKISAIYMKQTQDLKAETDRIGNELVLFYK